MKTKKGRRDRKQNIRFKRQNKKNYNKDAQFFFIVHQKLIKKN